MSSVKQTIAIAAVLLIAGIAGISLVADDSDVDAVPAPATTYTVKYVVGDNTIIKTYTQKTVTLASLDGEGGLGVAASDKATFAAWKCGANNYIAGSIFIFTDEPENTVTMTATFTPTVYTAQFVNPDGSEISKLTATLVKADGKTPEAAKDLSRLAPNAPAVDGKIFVGWLKEGATEPVKKADLGTLTANVKYTAVYMDDWKVTFADGDKSYVSKASAVAVPDLGTRAGFKFLGWFIGTEQIKAPAEYDFKADTTFTAKWEPVVLTVTFVAGEETLAVQPVKYGQTVNEPVVDFPEGYFGWDFDFSKAIVADTTINAKAVDIIEISFSVEGTVVGSTTNVDFAFPDNDPAKTGFKFKGWASAAGGEPIADVLAWVADLEDDATLFAVFEAQTFTVTFMDGDKVVLTQTVKYGEKASLPSTDFIGWQTKAVEVIPVPEGAPEGTEPTEKVTYTAYDFNSAVTGDVTLYGVEEDKSLSVGMQAALIIGVALVGVLAWAYLTGKLKVPKKEAKE